LPGDSGELIAASHTLSIAHPPGYPLYVMVGKLFASVVGWGAVAFRYNLLSALMGSVTSVVVFLLLLRVGVSSMLAWAVTVALATLETFWFQATTAEVYALNGLFTALLLYTALMGRKYGERALVLTSFLGGLALSHHLSLLYAFTSALVILVFHARVRPRAKTIVLCLLMLLLGLSTWLYIPIRANLGPPLTWDRTHTFDGFLSHITAQGYGWRIKTFDLSQRAADLIRYPKALVRVAGLPLLLLGVVGLVLKIRRSAVAAAMVCLVAFYAAHFAVYNIPDIESHLFPASIGVGLLAGLGLEGLARMRKRWRPMHAIIVAFAFVMIIINLVHIRPRPDADFAGDYTSAIGLSAAQACGDTCIVISAGDPASFPLLYASLVEPRDVSAFDVGLSNPTLIGAHSRPRSVAEAVESAAARFGISRIAILGPTPPRLLGEPTRICGMVYVIGEESLDCRPPQAYRIRGAGEEVTDHASQLLSGTYFLHLARWHLEHGDTAGAAGQIGRAVNASPDDPGIHIYAAQLHLQLGHIDQAFGLARTAIDIDTDFFEGHDLMANLLFSTGRARESIGEYEQALRGNPHPGPVYSNIGNAYSSVGEYSTALAYFEQATRLDSTLVNAYIGMGKANEALGRMETALASLGHARAIDPNSLQAYHAEASLFLRLEKFEDAMEVLRMGLARHRQNPLLLSDMGLCYLRKDVLDSATVYLEQAIEADRSLLSARGNLAIAYERKGQKAKAVEQYRAYVETAPPGPARQRASEALKRILGAEASTD
jgi:tetratricopeptide (TPR) repeat protein